MQIEDDGSLDVRATGVVGFNGALVAATIAAKGVLGHYWYTPLFGLGLSTLILIASLFGRLDRRLSQLEKRPRQCEAPKGQAGPTPMGYRGTPRRSFGCVYLDWSEPAD